MLFVLTCGRFHRCVFKTGAGDWKAHTNIDRGSDKMDLLTSFRIAVFILIVMVDDSSCNICGVLGDRRCRCQDFNVECTGCGYTRIHELETAYKALWTLGGTSGTSPSFLWIDSSPIA